MKYVLIFLVILICYNCDINNQKLSLINNSSDSIYYRLSIDSTPPIGVQLYEAFPQDTVWPNFVMGGEGAWEYKINKESKDSALYIFIFNKNLLNDSIIKGRLFKRMDFKVSELDRLKWVVVHE